MTLSVVDLSRSVTFARDLHGFLDEHGQHLVEWVHRAALQPLGDGATRVTEAQLVEDEVHTVRLDTPARPRQQPADTRE